MILAATKRFPARVAHSKLPEINTSLKNLQRSFQILKKNFFSRFFCSFLFFRSSFRLTKAPAPNEVVDFTPGDDKTRLELIADY